MPDMLTVRLEPDEILLRIESQVLAVSLGFMCKVARVRSTAYNYTTGAVMSEVEETVQVGAQDDEGILVLDLRIKLVPTAVMEPEPPADQLPVDDQKQSDPGF